jgi:hypothetical protein
LYYTYDNKKNDVLEFYDPYGLEIDSEFHEINNYTTPRYLAKLLLTSRYPVHYNEYPVQRLSSDVATCGRHVVNRILHSDLSLDKYNKKFGSKSGYNPDELVTELINI